MYGFCQDFKFMALRAGPLKSERMTGEGGYAYQAP